MVEATPRETGPNSSSTCALKIAPNADKFAHLLIECVGETVTDLLGTKVLDALLHYLAKNNGVTRHDIPEHLPDLSMVLDKTFGESGITIEKYIIRRLYATLKLEYRDTSNFDFSNQVNEARALWKISQDAGPTG